MKEKFSNYLATYGIRFQNAYIIGNINIPEEDLQNLLEPLYNKPLFNIDLDKISEELLNNTWVEEVVAVSRKLPREIEIIIREKTPIALWQINQKFYLTDTNGDIIETKYLGNFKNLLHVVGEGANVYAQDLIDKLYKYPEIERNITSAIRKGARRWDLLMQNGTIIQMPESGFDNALEYLHKMNIEKRLQKEKIKFLDLRIKGKYYIEKIPE